MVKFGYLILWFFHVVSMFQERGSSLRHVEALYSAMCLAIGAISLFPRDEQWYVRSGKTLALLSLIRTKHHKNLVSKGFVYWIKRLLNNALKLILSLAHYKFKRVACRYILFFIKWMFTRYLGIFRRDLVCNDNLQNAGKRVFMTAINVICFCICVVVIDKIDHILLIFIDILKNKVRHS